MRILQFFAAIGGWFLSMVESIMHSYGSPSDDFAVPSASDAKQSVKQQVLSLLKQQPMTCDEVAKVLNISSFTVRPRITELRNALIVVDSGERRELDSGKLGIVWRA